MFETRSEYHNLPLEAMTLAVELLKNSDTQAGVKTSDTIHAANIILKWLQDQNK